MTNRDLSRRARTSAARPALFALSLVALAIAGCSGDTQPLADAGPLPGTCTNDDGCATDQHCEDGMCVAGTGNACTMDSECGAGETCMIVTGCGATRCHGNTCVAKTCTTSADCGGWWCDGGTCKTPPACSADVPCPTDFTCGPEGLCVYAPGMPCQRDRDCTTEGEICLDGTCTPATACTTSADCPSDRRCIRDACRAPCTMASDCGTQIAWSCDTMTGECIQRCTGDNLCPSGTICEQFLCVPAECGSNEECTGANEECQGTMNGHGRCVEVFPCDAPGGCPEGTACNTTTNRCDMLPRCAGDRGCTGDTYCEGGYCQPSSSCSAASCAAGFDCVGGICVPAVCRGDADCTTAGERCISGSCQVPPMPTRVTQVRILTPAGIVRPGTTYRFTAVALDQTGAVVPGLTFDWTSTSSVVASIDGNGLATGGARAGTTIVIASLFNGTTTISSPGVNLVNLGPLATGDVRISVVGQAGGSPIGGAQVVISGSFGTLSNTTGPSGVVTFAGAAPTGAYSVTVAHAGYDFVSVLGLSATDVLVPLPPISKPSIAGGIKGTVDLSQVTSTGALSISLNGASIAPPLVSFDAASLFGGNLFRITIPNPQGGGNITVPVPAASTLGVTFAGTPISLKDTYYTRASTGIRAAWGLGGKIGLDAFGGGAGGGLTNIVGAILPYLQRFDHAVRPVVDVVALPTVVDSADIDGDGDTAETVPDYGNFPTVPLRPDTAQSLRYQIAVDNLPFVSGGNANTLLVVAGMILPSVGFVPLGLDGLQDEAGNGIVQPFITKIAPPHGGLEVGDYAVLATAVRLDAGGLPGPGSARLVVAPRLPNDVDVTDGWLDSPLDATWSEPMREVNLPPVANADYYRIALASEDGTWHIYTPTPDAAVGAITVPAAPMGVVDRATGAQVSVDAIDLTSGTDPGTLFDVSSGGTLALDRATRGFARAVLP